jgi:hypothetical protein
MGTTEGQRAVVAAKFRIAATGYLVNFVLIIIISASLRLRGEKSFITIKQNIPKRRRGCSAPPLVRIFFSCVS